MSVISREQVEKYFSTFWAISPEKLKDETLVWSVGGVGTAVYESLMVFGKEVHVRDPAKFTFGDLVRQVVS